MNHLRLASNVSYPILGLLLGAGAPVGSFLIRLLVMPSVRDRPLAEVRAHAFFYFYELIATSLVFALTGFVAGRRAHRLRQGATFYRYLAEHDALTGLHNARAFMDHYRRSIERAATNGLPIALIIADVDHLKWINDEHGHEAGNEALIEVANAIRASKRAADIAARWGGDEFSIVLEGADAESAQRVARGIVEQLRGQDSPFGPVTVTIGICAAESPAGSVDLFTGADRALLAGKARGRNTIEFVLCDQKAAVV